MGVSCLTRGRGQPKAQHNGPPSRDVGRLAGGGQIGKIGTTGGTMSKSLARVVEALRAGGHDAAPLEMPGDTRTAEQAAAAAGCALNQIVKSILFQGASGRLYLFLTAGGHQVDAAKASLLAGEPLGRSDAAAVREVTGFAIGGVAPVGHLTPSPVWMDPALMGFDTVWAAAGTPRHIFSIAPSALQRLSGAELAAFTQAQP
jgi:prolyl-tRNA editing enzyme YbaK/EbsC (Cys-tRNA(Pro) deacylase)